MVSSIQPLPVEVVHLIAAGEVIDSIAAVVRELAENALDAGATRIVISLWPESWRVRVADNGCGMDFVDLQQAASSHSTSKIHQCEDLWKINSLGFRGEALHSLAALAELEILSRRAISSANDEDRGGWRIVYNSQGEATQVETVAIAPGTVVTVSNLFGIWSLRRQGLPSTAQQLRAVQAIIHQIALCHPHVTWLVEQNDRQWFTISPGLTSQQILPQILRDLRLGDLKQLQTELQVEGAKQNSNLKLLIGLPDRCHRHRPDWVKVAINRRMVRSPELEQTILASFSRTLPRDRYPVCFLHLQIPPGYIDWNRHPAKAEIYLHQISFWQEQISLAIEQALQINLTNLADSAHSQRLTKLLKTAEEKAGYNVSNASDRLNKNNTEIGVMELRAIAQVHNTYILVEHPGGLWLIEQHIAHERVLYEQLCDTWQLVPVEPAIILNHLTENQRSQLERIGLDIQTFGDRLWAIRTAPDLLVKREDCAEALLELSCGGDLQAAQVATACRSAIRNGTPLTINEMQSLLNDWQRTRSPRTCPHGRPIYLSLEESALARFFRRHWVIGKSHGLK